MIGRIATAVAGVVGLLSLAAAILVVPESVSVHYSTVRGELSRCNDGYCIGDRSLALAFDQPTSEEVPPTSAGLSESALRRAALEGALEMMVGRQVSIEVDAATAVVSVNGMPVASIVEDQITTTTNPGSDPARVETSSPSGLLTVWGEGFCVGSTAVYFGPWWFVHHGIAPADLNGDGVVQTPNAELARFLGSEVTVTTAFGSNVVRTFDGIEWTAVGTEPPWSGGPVFGETPAGNADEEDGDGPPAHAGEEDGDGPPPGVGGG